MTSKKWIKAEANSCVCCCKVCESRKGKNGFSYRDICHFNGYEADEIKKNNESLFIELINEYVL